MLQKLDRFRTNETLLLAIDALLHSKSAFLSTFLMTYMIRISVSHSPAGYIIYKIISYALMALLAVALLHFIKRHIVFAWRLGILLSAVQIVAIVVFSQFTNIFPYIIAFISGFEAALYWRPTIFFSITEVSNDRRLRFQSLKQIITELIKIATPFALGLLITDTGYTNSATIILVISLVQFLLSILFRPSHKVTLPRHHISAVFRKIAGHRSLRRILYLQFLRGALISGAAYMIIPTLLVYDYTNSDLDLGAYTSIAAALAIAAILLLRHFSRRPRTTRIFLLSLIPLALTLPLILLFSPTVIPAVALYIFTIAIFEGLLNMFLTTRIQNSLKKHLGENAYTLEIEAISEVFLCTGRALSLILLLVVITASGTLYLPLFALLNVLLLIPTLLLATRRKKA
jgi:hypothetical protein